MYDCIFLEDLISYYKGVIDWAKEQHPGEFLSDIADFEGRIAGYQFRINELAGKRK